MFTDPRQERHFQDATRNMGYDGMSADYIKSAAKVWRREANLKKEHKDSTGYSYTLTSQGDIVVSGKLGDTLTIKFDDFAEMCQTVADMFATFNEDAVQLQISGMPEDTGTFDPMDNPNM